MGDTPERRKECTHGECRGVKKKGKGKRVGMEAVRVRVQASLCEVAIGRRIIKGAQKYDGMKGG